MIISPEASGTNLSGLAGAGPAGGFCAVFCPALWPGKGWAAGAAAPPRPPRISPRRAKSVLPPADPRAAGFSDGARGAGFAGKTTKPTLSPILGGRGGAGCGGGAGGGISAGTGGGSGTTWAAGAGRTADAGGATASTAGGAAVTKGGGAGASTVPGNTSAGAGEGAGSGAGSVMRLIGAGGEGTTIGAG